jgi:DNA-binding transcriptional LysR family regulator
VFQEQGLNYRSTMEVSSNETIKQAVIAGMGISFLSLHTAGLELQARKLVVLDVVGLPVVREWYVIHREDKRLSPAATAFRDFLKLEGATLIARAVDLPAVRGRPRKAR